MYNLNQSETCPPLLQQPVITDSLVRTVSKIVILTNTTALHNKIKTHTAVTTLYINMYIDKDLHQFLFD